MRKKVIPVMSLSYKSFCSCVAQGVKVIYVDIDVYNANALRIKQKLEENGYDPTGHYARKGLFFVRGINFYDCDFPSPYWFY